MPPKLVSELTEEEYKGYLFWLNYCCREGGCMVCDRPFCEGREKKMFMEELKMEITKIKLPVKALGPRCLKCPKLEIVCNEVNYGKEVKQYVYECKYLRHCLFLAGMLKEEQEKLNGK